MCGEEETNNFRKQFCMTKIQLAHKVVLSLLCESFLSSFRPRAARRVTRRASLTKGDKNAVDPSFMANFMVFFRHTVFFPQRLHKTRAVSGPEVMLSAAVCEKKHRKRLLIAVKRINCRSANGCLA